MIDSALYSKYPRVGMFACGVYVSLVQRKEEQPHYVSIPSQPASLSSCARLSVSCPAVERREEYQCVLRSSKEPGCLEVKPGFANVVFTFMHPHSLSLNFTPYQSHKLSLQLIT